MTQAAYIVTINDDGTITTESVDTDKGVARKASTPLISIKPVKNLFLRLRIKCWQIELLAE